MVRGGLSTLLFSILTLGATAQAPAAPVVFDWVTIGDPDNDCDPQIGFPCTGGVPYSYRIARFEVTNPQYAEFLNAVAAEMDTFGVYVDDMGSPPYGGIERISLGETLLFAVKPGFENRPVNYVSFWNALRFLNWLHNGQPVGPQSATTTEDGAYTISPEGIAMNTIVSNPGAAFFLPTRDEWHKAAYYDEDMGTFFDYPAASDDEIACAAPTSTANSANCANAVGNTTDVGVYAGSAAPSGTFDQAGNVSEWAEDAFFSGDRRFSLGASWILPASFADATLPANFPAGAIANSTGFRVGSMRPAPPSWPGPEAPNIGFDANLAPFSPEVGLSWSSQDANGSLLSGSLRWELTGCGALSVCGSAITSSTCQQVEAGVEYTLMGKLSRSLGTAFTNLTVGWYDDDQCASIVSVDSIGGPGELHVWEALKLVAEAPSTARSARIESGITWFGADQPAIVRFDDLALSRGAQSLENPFFDLDTGTPEGRDFFGLEWASDVDFRDSPNSGSGRAQLPECTQPLCTHIYEACLFLEGEEQILFGGRFRGNDLVDHHELTLEFLSDCDPAASTPSPPLLSRNSWETQELLRTAPAGAVTVSARGKITYAEGAEFFVDEMYLVVLPEPGAGLPAAALLAVALLRRRRA